MIRIAVVDDEETILDFVSDRILASLKKLEYNAKVDKYTSGKSFLDENSKYEYDIVFLDLDMPKFDGLQTAKYIRKEYSDEIIVIVTNRDDLVFDTFQYEVSAFIRKQYIDKEIDSVVERVCNKVKNRCSEYILKTEKGEISIKAKDIAYIEVHNHDVYLYKSSTDKIKIFYTLEKISNILSEDSFVRCHYGIIVGLQYIEAIDNDSVKLTIDVNLPLSRTRKKEVKNKFQRFMRSV